MKQYYRITETAFIALAVLSVAAWAEKSIAVLNLRSDQLKPADCISVTNFITNELQKVQGFRVLAWDDVTKMLELQAGKQALGCDDEKCFADIGGALGVDYIVAGDIGQLGSRYICNLKLIDIGKASTRSRVSESVTGDLGLFLEKLPMMVAQLLGVGVVPGATRQNSASKQPVPSVDGMVWIEGGTFMMGSEGEGSWLSGGGFQDEKPQHKVSLDGFYMDTTEVTQEQCERAIGKNPSKFKNCQTCPVDNVTWNEAKEYCQKIGKRLPTEAEWEYAARAGTRTRFYWGNTKDDNYMWYMGNAHHQTHPVAQKQPNAWRLYDMSGNVSEWCADWYDKSYYGGSPERNPQGPVSGKTRVLRGGDWISGGLVPSSTRRLDNKPDKRNNYYGFRCVRSR